MGGVCLSKVFIPNICYDVFVKGFYNARVVCRLCELQYKDSVYVRLMSDKNHKTNRTLTAWGISKPSKDFLSLNFGSLNLLFLCAIYKFRSFGSSYINRLNQVLIARLCCSILARLCFTNHLLSHSLTRCIVCLLTTVYVNVLPYKSKFYKYCKQTVKQ